MNDEPKRRGRPPRVETLVPEVTVDDKVVVENPINTPAERYSEQESEFMIGQEDISVAPAIISQRESPIEEKIHQLVDQSLPVDGWENDMRFAPIDGRRLMVSETAKDRGILVYWRISKVVDRKNLRYIPKGRWTDFLTKKDIEFVPSYWKMYNPEEYWPLTV